MFRESPSPGESRENGLEEMDQEEQDQEDQDQEEDQEDQDQEDQDQEDQDQEDQEDDDLDDEQDASQLERFMRDRRRAKSLPAYPALLPGDLPGGPGRKRVVFADSMGLNLASVKHFSSLEEPRVPSKVLSRYRSFPPPQQEPLSDRGQGFRSRLDTGRLDPGRLVACFPEPRDPELRVRQLRVCLERITITRFDVRGQIRVFGGGSAREVGVRYTFNDWRSCVDAQALVLDLEEPGLVLVDPVLVGERFSFTVYPPPCMQPGSAVHFALYLRTRDGDFWDNNQGQNYSLRYRDPPGPTTHVGHGSNAFHAV
ncbi:protein phosphatase 1 regulatory subunit 3G [Limanda limanda]|uniref:protein phosphatase 1 regulatory subunit 3G n=1 Tax=Limanda limanda TaxID=27771 RepID=UPI0029C71F5A|nr:protein phosphatase 1 regulatory subunit 3G [Limanda limanda]